MSSKREQPVKKIEEAIDRMRETVGGMTSAARDTVQTARVRPLQRYRERGGGPFLNSLRKNMDERPKITDRLTERLGQRHRFRDRLAEKGK